MPEIGDLPWVVIPHNQRVLNISEYPVLKANEKSGFPSSHAGHMELLTLCSIPFGSNQSIESTEV